MQNIHSFIYLYHIDKYQKLNYVRLRRPLKNKLKSTTSAILGPIRFKVENVNLV